MLKERFSREGNIDYVGAKGGIALIGGKHRKYLNISRKEVDSGKSKVSVSMRTGWQIR